MGMRWLIHCVLSFVLGILIFAFGIALGVLLWGLALSWLGLG